MSYTTIETFRTRFPEFGDTEDARVGLALSDAELQINVRAWRIKAPLGAYYLAAHMLAIEGTVLGGGTGGGSAAVGAVTSEQVGDVSRTYATVSSSSSGSAGGANEDLALTKYGLIFARLRRQVVASPLVI